MSKINLPPIQGGFASVQGINERLQQIEEAIENTVSRDGSLPNSMEADLDMDSNSILNAHSVNTIFLNVGGTTIVPGDPSNTVQLTHPYGTRQEFLDADIPPEVVRSGFIVNGNTYVVVRDITGPIEQTNGQRWKPDGTVTPQHFGAVGDGVTDDRAAIQAAIDAVDANGGGLVFFLPGVYAIASKNTVGGKHALTLKSHVSLRGADRESAIIWCRDDLPNDTPLLWMEDEDHIQVLDLTLDGNRFGRGLGASGENEGIDTKGSCSNLRVHNVSILNMGQDGIDIDGDCTESSVTECLIQDCGGMGIHNAATGLHISKCVIRNNGNLRGPSGDPNGGWGIDIHHTDVRITDCLFEDNYDGAIYCLSGAAGDSSRVRIVNCRLIGPRRVLSMQNDDTDRAVIGCYLEQTDPKEGAVLRVGRGDGGIAMSNIVRRDSAPAGSNDHGIHFSADNGVCSGNLVKNSWTGIFCTSNKAVISGNIIEGSVHSDIRSFGTSGRDQQIVNNICKTEDPSWGSINLQVDRDVYVAGNQCADEILNPSGNTVRNNTGPEVRTENWGQGTIPDGEEWVFVNHGLATIPRAVVTPFGVGANELLWVQVTNSTQIRVQRAGSSGDRTFNWHAVVPTGPAP